MTERRAQSTGADVLRLAAAADPFGHRVHMALAVAWAFFLPLLMIPWAKDVALVLLVIWSIARVLFGGVRAAWGPIFSMPITWFISAWGIWTCLSLAWSPAPDWGLEELRAFRSFLIPISLFPVLLHLRRVVMAFLIGVAIVNLIQIAQAVGIPGFAPAKPSLYYGWVAPNPGGLLIAAAFIAHIAWPIAERRGRTAVWHVAGAALAALGLLLMLNRGSMVAATVGPAVIMVVALCVIPRARVKVLLVATALTFGVSVGLLIDDLALDGAATTPVRNRIQLAMDDLGSAERFADKPLIKRSVTYRVEVWKATIESVQKRPLCGIGLGGLWHAFEAHPEFTNTDRLEDGYRRVEADHKHAHNSWLFVSATTGLIGLALMLGTLGSGLAAEVRRMASQPIALVGFGIVVSWMVANVFDSLILSGSTSQLLVLGLLAAWLPRSKGAVRAEDA
ncbi:MAG: O-antigen ligase family protein [Phycisphaerales bacterium]|nr:O-antigen ligase family protein [Phycisphaerales bacterium]